MKDAIKDLNIGVSKDPYGLPNEIYKEGIAGEGLLRGITVLMNKIKETQVYPRCLESCNITSIFKNKGNKSEFTNYRGIF